MNILLPVDDSDIESAKLCSIDDAQYWVLLDILEGKISNSQFYQSRDEISDWIDVVVVKDQKEHIWPFMEEGLAILVAPTQRYIEDIVEAYLFKELHDINS